MNRFFNLNKVITLAIFSVAIFSCTSDNEEDLFPVIIDPTDPVISLSTDVQPIIENSCAVTGCHVAGVQSPNFQDKGNIIGSAARIRVRAVALQTMPPSNKPDLTSDEIDILRDWIDQGATDN